MPSNEEFKLPKLESEKPQDETEYLMKSLVNKERLLQSIGRIKRGETTQRNLIED